MKLPNDLAAILLQRGWQASAGLLTIGLLVSKLSPDELGVYYSFLAIAGLSTLIDFGLGTVLLQKMARHFADVHWASYGNLKGAGSEEIKGLLSHAIFWYKIIGICFFVVLVPFGINFFESVQGVHRYDWLLPWVALCFFVALTMLLVPFFSLIEGSGRISEVYTVRFIQAVVGSLICWVVLIAKGGLWAAVSVPFGASTVGIVWLLSRYRPLIISLGKRNSEVSWVRDVWSFQWRIGLGMMCAYAQTQLISPLLLRTQGAKLAGQMGLTLAIINMLVLMTQPWLVRRVPELARAAVRKQYSLMDKIFIKNLAITVSLYSIGILIVSIAISSIPYLRLHETTLDIVDFLILSISVMLGIIVGGFVIYIRSFNTEPFVMPTVVSTLLILVIGYFALLNFSVRGYLLVLLLVNSCVTLPVSFYSWKIYRRELKELI